MYSAVYIVILSSISYALAFNSFFFNLNLFILIRG